VVDYALWATADPLTVEQAAYLWSRVEPSTPSYELAPNHKAAIAARLQMITGRIHALKVDTRTNVYASIGNHKGSLGLLSGFEGFGT
jgi:hypothetical protein